jgi:hypothetical protein
VYAVDVEAKPILEPTPAEPVEESEVDDLEDELEAFILRAQGLQAPRHGVSPRGATVGYGCARRSQGAVRDPA